MYDVSLFLFALLALACWAWWIDAKVMARELKTCHFHWGRVIKQNQELIAECELRAARMELMRQEIDRLRARSSSDESPHTQGD